MSPEQAQGRRITKRSDLYSLGAVMYVMLTGRPPFSGKTTLDVLQKHKYSQFDRPQLLVPDIPYWLDEIVCKLMEKDPDKRFADAYVVNRRLQEVQRKVDISTNDMTLGEGTSRTDASTVAVGSEPRREASAGPGPGTLMRDLFRAQIEASKGRRDLRRILENTWVLVGMLVLLVAGVGYWMHRGGTSPERRFEQGVKLLDEDEEANWRTVRDDYFAPLLDVKSPEWDKKLAPYMERIAFRELKAAMTGRSGRLGLRRSTGPDSEIGRLVTLALHEKDDGNLAGAERTLSALSALLEGNPKYESKARLVDECLQSLRDRRAAPPPDFSFLDDALERADSLAASGKRDDAAQIWQGVIELYGHDPQAAAEVERARKGLAEPKVTDKPPPVKVVK
jgi:Protein kinase domain